jgi:hypothetical protein
MISLKELENVNERDLKFVKYPGDVYAKKALLNLSKAYKLYEKIYSGASYTINFSDGDELQLEIVPSNLSHMMGLDPTSIKNFYLDLGDFDKTIDWANNLFHKGQNLRSHELLKIMADENNHDSIIKLSRLSHHTIINFYRVSIRSEAFNRFSSFLDMDFGCIKYDPKIVEKNGSEKTALKSDRILFVESNENNAPYFMMGIAIGENGNSYIETLFADMYTEKMFKNQTITLPISVTVENEHSLIRHEATASQKLYTYKMLKEIVLKYGSNLDIFADYSNVLARQSNEDSKIRTLKRD